MGRRTQPILKNMAPKLISSTYTVTLAIPTDLRFVYLLHWKEGPHYTEAQAPLPINAGMPYTLHHRANGERASQHAPKICAVFSTATHTCGSETLRDTSSSPVRFQKGLTNAGRHGYERSKHHDPRARAKGGGVLRSLKASDSPAGFPTGSRAQNLRTYSASQNKCSSGHGRSYCAGSVDHKSFFGRLRIRRRLLAPSASRTLLASSSLRE
ncbi:hypothetical protein C8Q79DRAFT_45121 [Trametes meyenii]|nr:hypothetical protein C8Q79DRAFT_45121 [Trametes meyenii]